MPNVFAKSVAAVVHFLIFLSSSAHVDLPQAKPVETVDPQIAILCYHHVDLPLPTPYSVSSKRFVDQLDALSAAGFEFISVPQLERYYYEGERIPTLSAVITFDDGNLNNYTVVYPLLKKKAIPWTLFVYPTLISAGHRHYALNWTELREMAEGGVNIGCHAYTHPFLIWPGRLDRVNTPAQYLRWLDMQIAESRKVIEERLGTEVKYFAYPFGATDAQVVNTVIQSKYALGFNVNGSNNGAGSQPFNLNRIIVNGYMTPDYLVQLALRRPIYFESSTPADLARVSTNAVDIQIKIKDADKYDAQSWRLSVSGFPEEKVNVINGELKHSIHFLRNGLYVISVKATAHGIAHLGTILFVCTPNWPTYLAP